MKQEYSFTIESDKLNDLIELTEEPNLSKTVITALSLYYDIMKWRSKGYRLALLPIHIDTGQIDNVSQPILLNID